MTAPARNGSLSVSRRRIAGYDILDDPSNDPTKKEEKDRGWRAFSRRKKEPPQGMMEPSYSYRRKRAKQRQIFLTTYKLSSVDAIARSKSEKLKEVAVNVKKAVFSVVSLVWIGSISSCSGRSAFRASPKLS